MPVAKWRERHQFRGVSANFGGIECGPAGVGSGGFDVADLWRGAEEVFQAEPRVLGGQVTAHNQHGRSPRYTQPRMRAGSWPTIELQTINFQWRRPPLVRASNALVRGEGRRRFSERLFGQTAKQMIKREERMNAGR